MTLPVNDTRLYAVAEIVSPHVTRPATPRACAEGRYHVWVWKSTDDLHHEDLRAHVPAGLRCQCGAIPWEDGMTIAAPTATRRPKAPTRRRALVEA